MDDWDDLVILVGLILLALIGLVKCT